MIKQGESMQSDNKDPSGDYEKVSEGDGKDRHIPAAGAEDEDHDGLTYASDGDGTSESNNKDPRWLMPAAVMAFSVSTLAEVGYGVFAMFLVEGTLDAIVVAYLVKPHLISEKIHQNANPWVGVTSQILAWGDVALTVLATVTVKEELKKFIPGIKKHLNELHHGSWLLRGIAFINWLLAISYFLTGSLAPATAFRATNFNLPHLPNIALDIGMTIAQLSTYLILNTNYALKAPKIIYDGITKGIARPQDDIRCSTHFMFVLRSMLNMVIRSWQFWGLAMLQCKYLFNNESDALRYIHASLAAFSAFYYVVFTWISNDFTKTYGYNLETGNYETSTGDSSNPTAPNNSLCDKLVTYPVLYPLLACAFLARMLIVPELFNGNKSPNDYNTEDRIIYVVGIVLGGIGSVTYCRFMEKYGQDALTFIYGAIRRCNAADNEVSTVMYSADTSGETNRCNWGGCLQGFFSSGRRRHNSLLDVNDERFMFGGREANDTTLGMI